MRQQVAALFITKRPVVRFPLPSTFDTMKLRYSILGPALASSMAWQQMIPSALAWTPSSTARQSILRPFSSSPTVLSSFALRSTLVPEEVEACPALTPTGKTVAEGSVVSFFKGGFVAVKIDDDDGILSLSGSSNDVIDTTKSLPKEISKSTAGGDLVGRQVIFANDQVGVVVAHRPPMVFVYSDMEEFDSVDGPVKVLDSLASVAVSNASSALDCFGRTLDNSSTSSETTMKRPIFSPIPQVKDIALINSPMVSGVTMFDALSPIGLGQNMLLVGHDIKDMRRYACDILSMQSSDTKCIYAATSNREEVEQTLADAGLLEDITLVAQKQTKSEKSKESDAAEAIFIAASACAMGEAHAIEEGKNAVIIVDTIDHHKQLWDATTRVLVDVFGAEAVVKGDREGAASSEMRSFYSSLIQRSAQYNKKRGGGSVTLLLMTTIPKMAGNEDETVFVPEEFKDGSAKVQERIQLLVAKKIPLTAANLRKIDIPIPSDSEGVRRVALQHVDDLISMSDGQIWLDERLEEAGRQPPMDPQRSITRIGIGADTKSRADAPALRRIVEGLRLDLAQVASMDGADTATNASVKQIRRSNALLLAMHQRSGATGRKLSESCVVLLAATKGHLDSSVDNGILPGTDEGNAVVRELLEHVALVAPSAMADVDASQDLSESSLSEMEEAIKLFFTF